MVLPTVWDPWSATVAVEAGFAALTVGSHPAAEALGSHDGEGLTLDEMLAQVQRITRAVDVPVSADLESGYGESAQRIIDGLLAAGAVGLNIEDTVHSEGGRMRSDAEHADLVAGLRAAADAAGVAVVINARTDILMNEIGPAEDRFDRAVRRLGSLPRQARACSTPSARTRRTPSVDSPRPSRCRSTRSGGRSPTRGAGLPMLAWRGCPLARICKVRLRPERLKSSPPGSNRRRDAALQGARGLPN